MSPKKKHEDTRISLDGMTIEEASKKAVDAGSPPTKKAPKRPSPAGRRTSRAARQSGREYTPTQRCSRNLPGLPAIAN